MSARDDELVLGLPRSRLLVGSWWRGVRTRDVDGLLATIAAAGEYRRRGDVEDDATWKQVIPYVVLRDGPLLFLMRRTRAGGDARLFERYTIGVGGHVNPPDRGLGGGLLREWREELDADWDPEFRLVGMLNDDDDPVGAVHLGIVYEVEAAGRPVAVRETDKLTGTFAAPEDVRVVLDRMETWSALVFEHFEPAV
jgi:predicted NUDIX family phosphoesterase